VALEWCATEAARAMVAGEEFKAGERALDRVFKALDVNPDGKVSRSELLRA
jgi:Ca2+-binding EF-hand superfamily protein